jgi:hypothetical protein
VVEPLAGILTSESTTALTTASSAPTIALTTTYHLERDQASGVMREQAATPRPDECRERAQRRRRAPPPRSRG